MKKVFEGKCFADVEEVKRKNGSSPERHQNGWGRGERYGGKEGEGSGQETGIKDPRTWKTGVGMEYGRADGYGRGQ